jgi:hypothetical protein
VTPPAITRAVDAGRLHRVHPGVYALGHRALSLEGRIRAALLYAGPGAVLSHTTAGWVWGILDHQPSRIHVTVPRKRRSEPGVRIHRTRFLDKARHRGLPVTGLARTLRDLAWVLPAEQLRRALAEADYRGLLNAHHAYRVLGRGRRGSAALREALAAHMPELAQAYSVLEQEFLLLCERSGIPPPEVNVDVAGMIVDALWRQQQVVVELDGYRAHRGRERMERDRRRELALRAAGLPVLRYTWHQVITEPERVVADLRTALARGRSVSR